jgi:phage/plasmid-associated DNA primase
MVVECPNIIPKNKQDKLLLEKMYAERDGIVFKAIKALQRVIANGYRFTEPESVARAREKYMAENNTVISFYEECMCQRPNGKICDAATTGRIYDVYRAWCQNNNNGFAKTAKEFRETLAKHLGTTFKEMSTHTNKGTFYKDLTITIDTKEQYKKVYGYDSTDYLA